MPPLCLHRLLFPRPLLLLLPRSNMTQRWVSSRNPSAISGGADGLRAERSLQEWKYLADYETVFVDETSHLGK